MTTFKTFISESSIIKTKRTSIPHFQQMKPLEFYKFIKDILANGGKLENIPMQLKVDGASCRFGKDVNGEFFFETGGSGPIQNAKAFSSYTKQKSNINHEVLARAYHYDDIYEHLKACDIWKDLPNDVKIVAEILYNPMGESEKNQIKFVTVKYDKDKLGTLMSIVPYKVLNATNGETHKDEKKILKSLISKSKSDIKIISSSLQHLTINISTEINGLKQLTYDVESILSSLKKADKQKKEDLTSMLQSIKNSIADKILKHHIKGIDVLGNEIEGYILDLNGTQYKITTPSFKNQRSSSKTT